MFGLHNTQAYRDFENMHTAILGELKKRDIQGLEDTEELAKALSVLAADSLDLDIYQ